MLLGDSQLNWPGACLLCCRLCHIRTCVTEAHKYIVGHCHNLAIDIDHEVLAGFQCCTQRREAVRTSTIVCRLVISSLACPQPDATTRYRVIPSMYVGSAVHVAIVLTMRLRSSTLRRPVQHQVCKLAWHMSCAVLQVLYIQCSMCMLKGLSDMVTVCGSARCSHTHSTGPRATEL